MRVRKLGFGNFRSRPFGRAGYNGLMEAALEVKFVNSRFLPTDRTDLFNSLCDLCCPTFPIAGRSFMLTLDTVDLNDLHCTISPFEN
jgi:hypothetical protein